MMMTETLLLQATLTARQKKFNLLLDFNRKPVILIYMIKKRYEVIKDGMLEGGFEKSRDGMNDAIQLVEELAIDYMGEYDCLEIVYTEYDELEQIVHCEQVQEFEDDSLENDIDESMDGDFDSAMTSAGFGTDEDYGYFGD